MKLNFYITELLWPPTGSGQVVLSSQKQRLVISAHPAAQEMFAHTWSDVSQPRSPIDHRAGAWLYWSSSIYALDQGKCGRAEKAMWAERRRTGRGGRRAPFSQHVVLLHSAPLLIKLPLTTKSEATTGHAHYFTRPNGGGCTTQSNKSVCVGGGSRGREGERESRTTARQLAHIRGRHVT